jgi:hypothetical protein
MQINKKIFLMKSFTLKYFFVNLLFLLFLNQNSNKTIAYKKEYFIKKIEITAANRHT